MNGFDRPNIRLGVEAAASETTKRVMLQDRIRNADRPGIVYTTTPFAPSFSLLDSKHVAGIVLRSDNSAAYGGDSYDIIGPTGSSLGYPTVAAKAGDTV